MKSRGEHHLFYPMRTTLVTSWDDENRRGNVMVADWSMPCSFEPFMVVVSIGKTRHSHRLIAATKEFGLCFPPAKLRDKVVFCGTRHGSQVDKIKEGRIEVAKAKRIRAPLVKGCACLECRVVEETEAGDHTLFLGEVVEVHGGGKGKKLFSRG